MTVFREHDIRGVADRDLGDDLVQKIGRGLARMLRTGGPEGAAPRIVVGRDCRASGPRLFDALVHGLVDGGVDVIDIGVGPTPLLHFAVRCLEADGGVMITGGHDAGDKNGFKITRANEPFFGGDIVKLQQRVQSAAPPLGIRGSLQTIPVDDAYLDNFKEVTVQDTGMKVVVDAGNGAAGPLGLRALRGSGLAPTPLFCRMDGSFPHHPPDPKDPANLQALIAGVREQSARVGVAWDGDGDRLGVVDADGTVVSSDRLLALFARDVLRESPGAAIVCAVSCSQTAVDDIASRGGRPIRVDADYCLMRAKMAQEGALVAGEGGGHYFFRDRYFGFDDGIYAALRLLEILAREGKTVGDLLADFEASR